MFKKIQYKRHKLSLKNLLMCYKKKSLISTMKKRRNNSRKWLIVIRKELYLKEHLQWCTLLNLFMLFPNSTIFKYILPSIIFFQWCTQKLNTKLFKTFHRSCANWQQYSQLIWVTSKTKKHFSNQPYFYLSILQVNIS